MAVTGLSIVVLAMAAASPREVVSEMAASLAAENPSAFVRCISSTMADREALARNIRALDEGYEISSSIEVISESQSGESSDLELDWFLELKPRTGIGELIRRRDRIRIVLGLSGKSWKVTSLQPLTFFSPP